MTRGHQYITFGKEYERAVLGSVNALRKFSKLPVHIVTNIPKNQLSAEWKKFKKITFTCLSLPDGHNRHVKTRMYRHTPFDETLYTDCDTVIQSAEFMEAFNILESCDIAFPMHSLKGSTWRLKTKIYRRAIKQFKADDARFVYQGGVCAYKKNENTQRFFDLWHSYWNIFKFRDMPSLACVIHNITDVSIGVLPSTMGFDNSTIIQHFYGWKPPKSNDIPQFTKVCPNEGKMRWEPRKCFR